jgi:hypothetical protein
MSDPKLLWLRLVVDHYLCLGYPYDHARAIGWHRNDTLGCDPVAVDQVCRDAIKAACASGEWQVAFRRRSQKLRSEVAQ